LIDSFLKEKSEEGKRNDGERRGATTHGGRSGRERRLDFLVVDEGPHVVLLAVLNGQRRRLVRLVVERDRHHVHGDGAVEGRRKSCIHGCVRFSTRSDDLSDTRHGHATIGDREHEEVGAGHVDLSPGDGRVWRFDLDRRVRGPGHQRPLELERQFRLHVRRARSIERDTDGLFAVQRNRLVGRNPQRRVVDRWRSGLAIHRDSLRGR